MEKSVKNILWGEDGKVKRGFFMESIFMGTANEASEGLNSDDLPLFYNAGLVPGGPIEWDTPGQRIAQAIIYEALTTASLPPFNVTKNPKNEYYRRKREKDREEAIEWIMSDDEENDRICLHTFNNCCMFLNVPAEKIRKEFVKRNYDIRLSMHNTYDNWPKHSKGR